MKKLRKILTGVFLLSATFTVTAHAQDDYIVHTIKKGEILTVLARKYGVTPEAIAKLNNFNTNHILHVGDKVKLPAGASYRELPDTSAAQKPEPAAEVQKPEQATQTQPAQTGYVTHVIKHGEVYSVLSKKYNVPVDEILRINNFKGNHVLHVGDKIKLPATAVAQPEAATQPAQQEAQPAENDNAANAQGSTIHVVQKKETLYSISKKYNVTVNEIKAWNNLKSNSIDDGQKLVIHTPVANNNTATEVQQEPQQKATAPPVVTSSPAEKLPVEEKKAVTPQTQPVIKEENIPETGYFSPMFGVDVAGRKLQTANGIAMTFKTASGWTDKKYYILMNDVPPGSVVQVTNQDGKAIYAKVLWNMGDLKDNDGLNFRISDAAASALNLKDNKFQLAVTYYE
ncbi:MAG TPA: LysM peptidoglycan-binding domain-containing protein [Chitinophagaceae bacterium]|nr:LysM peptidoglycan-binding domain-containing protein [Chitinophagaceae bacterium]